MHTEVHWHLEGRPKAGDTGTMPLLYHRFHVLELPVQDLTFLKFCTLNFLYFFFRIARFHAKYMKICAIQKFPAIQYHEMLYYYKRGPPIKCFATDACWLNANIVVL